jgi:serine/threonine-protein kinase
MSESPELPPLSSDRPGVPDGQSTQAASTPSEQKTLPRPEEPPVERPLPAQAGRHQIVGEIARGGIGAVLQGRDPVLGRDLAIKILLDKPDDRPEDVQRTIEHRFIEEAQIGGQLQHPGIVPVYELGQLADGRPYFTMKLVKGRTLAELLQERPSPEHDLPRFLKVFEQVCQTAAYAHARHVIHRDLKPLNVMVGAFGEVQVMDWGLAKVLAEPANRAEATAERRDSAQPLPPTTEVRTARADQPGFATQTGSAWGTYAYMPPEQARGQVELLDERCDVFALGAILCEILTGKPPYVGPTVQDLYFQSFSGDLADAQTRLDTSGADAELLRLTRACLAVKPDDRPRNAGQVAEAVAAFLASMQERLRIAEIERAAAQARAEEEAKTRAAAQARARAERWARRLTVGLALSLLGLFLLGGSIWLRGERDRAEAARRAQERDRQFLAELQRATALMEEAERTSPVQKQALLNDALAAAEGARRMLTEDPADEALRERVDTLRNDLREQEHNRRMVARLEEARHGIDTSKRGPSKSAGAAYAAAFRDYDIDVLTLPRDQAVERLRSRPIRSKLATALDIWALLFETDGERQKALQDLAKAVDPDPDTARYRAALERGDLEELKGLAASPKAASLPPPTILVLASSLISKEAVAEAEALLRRAQLIYAGDFDINSFLAWLLLEVRKPPQVSEAIRFYSIAVALRGHSAAAHVSLGNALRAKGRFDEAIAACRKGLELDPEYATGYYAVGSALFDARRFPEAVGAYRKAAELQPEAYTYHALGATLQAGHLLPEAVAAFRKAVELKPDYVEGYCALGSVLTDLGRLEEGIAAYRKALELKPDDTGAHEGLAWVFFNREEFAAAQAVYQKRQELSAKDADERRVWAEWARRAARLAELAPRAAAVQRGEAKPASAEDRLLFARLFLLKSRRLHATSARLFEETFAARPELAEDLQLDDLYNAACAAALAGCGQGADAAGLDARERARWRRQALTWFRANLALWAKELQKQTPQARSSLEETLRLWQTDDDLTGLRDAAALAQLPPEEREACRRFWADVAALMVKARAQE